MEDRYLSMAQLSNTTQQSSMVEQSDTSQHRSNYHEMLRDSKIHVMSDYHEVDAMFRTINSHISSLDTSRSPTVVGFDTEWNSYKVVNRPISLIQISIPGLFLLPNQQQSKDISNHAPSFTTFLIRLIDVFGERTYDEYQTNNLVTFLENPKVHKVGVNIMYDKSKLFEDYGIKLAGSIELGNLYRLVRSYDDGVEHSVLNLVDDKQRIVLKDSYDTDDSQEHNKQKDNDSKTNTLHLDAHLSLSALAHRVCDFIMPKHHKVRCSNWEDTLTHEQIMYGAADSFYGLKIFIELMHNPHHLDIAWLVDQTLPKKRKQMVSINDPPISVVNEDSSNKQTKDQFKTTKTRRYKPSTRPIFDNYTVNNKDGHIMFYCSKRKADWYVKKRLGKYVDDKIIQLSFHTKRAGFKFNEYWCQKMICRCVICGNDKDLIHHMVVPKVFRAYFPIIFTTENGYDNMAMCIQCKFTVDNKYTKHIDDLMSQHNVFASGSTKSTSEIKNF